MDDKKKLQPLPDLKDGDWEAMNEDQQLDLLLAVKDHQAAEAEDMAARQAEGSPVIQ